jgi:hypothetical protein
MALVDAPSIDALCNTYGVKRERAAALVEELLIRLTMNCSEWPLTLITSVDVFGSFARRLLIHTMSIWRSHSNALRSGSVTSSAA